MCVRERERGGYEGCLARRVIGCFLGVKTSVCERFNLMAPCITCCLFLAFGSSSVSGCERHAI